MNEVDEYIAIFPPDLKIPKKPYIERFIVCPHCHEYIKFDYLPGGCGNMYCINQKCKASIRYVPHGLYCHTKRHDHQREPYLCGSILDCFTNGMATIQEREMWKPYSLIKPRRLTRWD